MNTTLLSLIDDMQIVKVAGKVLEGQRISDQDALYLYQHAPLPVLGMMADYIREKKHGHKTFFNRNFHIEPTNICIHQCKFCSYSRTRGQEGAWEYSIGEMLEMVRSQLEKRATEVHVVGGVHPDRDLYFYGTLLRSIKELAPHLHIKAFTAVEIDFMVKKAGLSLQDGLQYLRDSGLGSLPGGGAEIFAPEVRGKICGEKSTAKTWLDVHRAAHLHGIPSNATMLYGHVESYAHRVDHLSRLRHLQDETKGFNAFIPLKYRSKNNPLSSIGEVNTIEDLKNYAVARIYLDNFDHLKAYWVMLGKETTQLSLSFGVDDIDGTIEDSTKIYSMAGAESDSPAMTVDELASLVKAAGRIPIERDSLYRELQTF